MKKLTVANEDYLEAIVELCDKSGSAVRSVDVATQLGVSKASVNKAVAILKDAGYVDQPFYGDITLTDEGRAYGEEVLGRHHALYSFLRETLGVDEETSEREACAMEHTISNDTMRRWVAYLSNQKRGD
ncbi:MAG: metal-dependent transcriptional regulator [Actinobacteria bacterium]|nr:metal-dependent transcriptional regulator [Actinomycetota bacterium]